MENQGDVPKPKKESIGLRIIIVVLILMAGGFYWLRNKQINFPQIGLPSSEGFELTKFASDEEFRNYIAKAVGLQSDFNGSIRELQLTTLEAPTGDKVGAPAPEAQTSNITDVSQTNVQVEGVDEPDIVKTDGNQIYFSSDQFFIPLYERSIDPGFAPELSLDDISSSSPGSVGTSIFPVPDYQAPTTKVIKAFPPQDIAKIADIDTTGDLLLAGKKLVVFSGQKVLGYDVSNPSSPQKSWEFELDDNAQIVSSRLLGGKIYTVTKTYTNASTPCPMPLTKGVTQTFVPCIDIYRPAVETNVDSTFTVIAVNPDTGAIENKVSFLGTTGLSVVYVSPENIYATFTYYKNSADFAYNFIVDYASDLFDQTVVEKVKKLKDYDISSQGKEYELGIILSNFYASLSDDQRLKIETELNNKLTSYLAEHGRELEGTGIAKISVSDLSLVATGQIPGHPLNQFSLDEYQKNLRVATTTNAGLLGSRGQSVNDVYVLNENLKTVGQVLDLGKTEQIYSARFIEDKGYIVTFRQIDPFYVLDLSDPANPKQTGEMKIPGYSSYLHPIAKDKILGVGQEGSGVKVSLFDVNDPANPTEKSKYNLDEYWTEVQNNHHAFLLDDRYSAFFIPGGKGGYIFTYKGDNLELAKAVSDTGVKRAITVNNFIYIIGNSKITVLNEESWSEVSSLGI